jgi:hypothetical protein
MLENVLAERKTRFFVSYSRKDEPTVLKLVAALEAASDLEALRDKKDILPGEEWRGRLEGLVVAADVVLVCLSPDSIASPEVKNEIETANRLSKRILPVVLRRLEAAAPAAVASLNYFFLTDDKSWDAEIASLRTAIHTNIGWLREHTRIGELSQKWQTDGKRADTLLRGGALDEAERWASNQPDFAPAPSPLQRDFIATSRRAATGRQRNWTIGSLLVAAVAIVLTVIALWQRNVAVEQRTEATARRLSAEAQLVLSDPLARGETAVRNLLVSLTLAPAADARQALSVGTNRLEPKRVGNLPLPEEVKVPAVDPMLADESPLTFSDDGVWLGMVAEGEALFWNVRTRTLERRYPLPKGGKVAVLRFAPGRSQALISQREAGATEPNAWTVIDLSKPDSRSLTSAEAFDVRIVGRTILMLAKTKDGGAAVVDLTDGKTIATPSLNAKEEAIAFGRIVDPLSGFMGLRGYAAGGGFAVIVLIDGKGAGTFAPVGPGEAKSFLLPSGAQPIALGAFGLALAIRVPGANDQAIALATGKPIWQASTADAHIKKFARDGRFLVIEDRGGVRLESLESLGGGQGLLIENSRRTDYDMSTQSDLSRYTPIVAVGLAERSQAVATAWKDGRIALWEATIMPRFGALPMPSPDFQPLARFDHGQDLGSQVRWVQLPSLFISPSGRFVASESLGLKTNPAGGVTGMDPLVRIWDRYRGGEIARFRPASFLMLASFAPGDDLLATVELPQPTADGREQSVRLALWTLREAEPAIESRREGAVALSEPANAPAKARGPLMIRAVSMRSAAAIWVGFDLKVRAMNLATGDIEAIDDVSGPVAEMWSGVADGGPSEGERKKPSLTEVLARARGTFSLTLDAPFFPLPLTTFSPAPETPLPLFPLAVSGDGRRALLVAGTSVRFYGLDGAPRLLRTLDLGPMRAKAFGIRGGVGAAISRDGETFAISVLAAADEPQKGDAPKLSAAHLVFAADAATPQKSLTSEVLSLLPAGMVPRETIVALGPKAAMAVVDEIVTSEDKRVRPVRRAVLRDLTSGRDIVAFPARELTMGPTGLREADGSSVAAGFDALGTRLAVLRDRPDCPMKIETSTAWMPISVPSCPERSIEIEVWDLTAGKQIGASRFVVNPEKGEPPGPGASAFSLPGAAPYAVNLTDPATVVATGATLRGVNSDEGWKLEVELVGRSLAVGADDAMRRTACERLPLPIAQFDRAAWNALLPDESFRPICSRLSP